MGNQSPALPQAATSWRRGKERGQRRNSSLSSSPTRVQETEIQVAAAAALLLL
eukprot:CAMPEP_0194564446 /NCGR_PEP_ID=MMETSP0292-20121207/4099_1 /TAXON_ID=39354 /ORGANISM="Heterosigma akashiwo, Strain CCMP2393" /LENGTH=52 /DNA_ID=CAMNT_0039413579 /DNA_START=155 /DNA_END=309 /DNA_ORIENTATION=-